MRTNRNGRRWYEDNDIVVLDKSGVPTLVTVAGMSGDTREGEVIYYVQEFFTHLRYPASDRSLRKPKPGEQDRLLAEAKERAPCH